MIAPVPEDFHTITPQLTVNGVADAIAWYTTALGANELLRNLAPDGKKVMHAELLLGDSRFFVVDEFPGSMSSPNTLGGTPITLHLYVTNVDALFQRAVAAGATVLMAVADQFWGDRYGMLADPFGHRWSIASRIEDLSPKALQARAADWARETGGIMSYSRLAATVAAAFVVSQILAVAVHGFILAADYAPFDGTLLRPGAAWQMLFLPVAHLLFIATLVWVSSRLQLTGSALRRGLALGVVGWAMGQAPLWLLWYAEQPWPDTLVVKQLGLELVSSLLIGLTIVLVSGTPRTASPQAAATV